MNTDYKPFGSAQYNAVQGQPVQGQTVNASVYGNSSGYPELETKGHHQPKRCNDAFWGVLFFAHIAFLAALAITYIPQLEIDFSSMQNYGYNADGNNAYADYYDDGNGRNLNDETRSSMTHMAIGAITRALFQVHSTVSHRALEDADSSDPDGLFLLIGLTAVCGFFISILSLTIMIRFAEVLIKASIIFSVLLGLVVAGAGFLAGSMEAGLMGLLVFALAACYAWMVWSRIPFAATNLVTASTAIKANIGVIVFAYCAIIVNGLWIVFWSAATYSTIFVTGQCNAAGECANEINSFYVFLFFVSLFWSIQVIKNVVHVTVAGTVGTWWWTPLEASGCCSKAVRESHNRAMTYSFGSICFGSLLVAIIQAIKQMVENARESDDGMLRCVADCILGCLEVIMEMFNEWAFVYVGLYGYSFIDAAKNVITLFKSRGWTAIITDYIVDRVLMMISFGNGLITGGCAALISYMFNLDLEGVAFTIGFVVGMLLTTVLLSVVGSGVNTVVVCYAEDPATFEINHYELSIRMRESWRVAFPNDFKY